MLVYFVVVIYLQARVCVCVCGVHVWCIVIFVFRYTLFSYMHIKSFYFLHVNQQDVTL